MFETISRGYLELIEVDVEAVKKALREQLWQEQSPSKREDLLHALELLK